MFISKLTRFAAAALLIAGVGFASCSKDDGGNDSGSSYDRVVRGAKGYYVYNGSSDNGTGSYTLYISTAEISASGWTGPGDIYQFAVYSDMPSNANAPLPARGSYRYDSGNSHADNTFAAEGSMMWSISASGSQTGSSNYSDGSLTLRGTDASPIIEGEVTLSNGTTVQLVATSLAYAGSTIEIGDLQRDVQMGISYTNGGVERTEEGSYNVYGNNTTSYILHCYDEESDQVRLQLNLIGPGTADDAVPVLETGDYTLGTEPAEFSCLAGSADLENATGSFYDASGLTGEVGWLTTGSIKVSGGEGNVYTIEINAETNQGRAVTGTYTGGVILNGGNVAPTTTLTDDAQSNFEGVTTGILNFYGAALEARPDLGYTVIDLAPQGGNQAGFVMAILLPDSNTRELAEGTYAVTNDYTANMLYPGMITSNNEFEPSAYYVTDANNQGTTIQAPVQAGKVTIARGEGDTWEINIDVYDDANNHITGYWVGPLKIQEQ